MTVPHPHIRIWQQPDRLWRWCYVEPGQNDEADVTLISHRAYDSEQGARHSAHVAYPDIDLPPVHQPATTSRGARRTRRRTRALLVVVVAVTALYLLLRRAKPRGRPT